jgi:hypothetical protein
MIIAGKTPPELFVWSDGKRPSLTRPGSIAAWVAFYVALRADCVIIFANNTRDAGENWNDTDLIAASAALREAGIRVIWMFWAFSSVAAVRTQLADLDRLFGRFVPDGVQWDAEEGWDDWEAEPAAKALNAGLEQLNADHDCDPEYSVTAISIYGKRTFTARVLYLHRQPMIRMAYGQAYLFWNSKVRADGRPHWSQGLPRKPGALMRGVTEAWLPLVESGDFDGYYLGLAAHMQDWPARLGLPPYKAMEDGIESYYQLRGQHGADVVRGLGYWSRKHLVGSAGKRAVVSKAKRPQDNVRRAQTLLALAGYDAGASTGIVTPMTRKLGLSYLRDRAFFPADRYDFDGELAALLTTCLRVDHGRSA